MARRSVGRTLVRTPKRPTFWEGANAAFTVATGASATVTVVTEATLENTPNPTLIRIHGDLIVNVTARTAAQDSACIAVGLIAQSRAAIAAGVASMPLPGTDIGSPWIWHRLINVRSNVAPVNGTDLLGNRSILIDNKSMRKFDLNQGLVMVVENTVITGTITVTLQAAFRFLFKR